VVIALVQKRKPPVFESALLAGSLAFVVLFFEKLKDHDYYFLTLLPSFLLLMHCAMQVWHSSKLPVWSKSLVQMALLVMTVVSIHYGSQRAMKRFFHPEKTSQEIVMNWLGADEQIMISRSTTEADTLWIQGDNSPNAGLMLLGRKGFTDFNLPVYSIESTKPKFIITPLYLADRIGFSDSLYSPVGFSNQAILFERK
jgi:hypothetical protein